MSASLLVFLSLIIVVFSITDDCNYYDSGIAFPIGICFKIADESIKYQCTPSGNDVQEQLYEHSDDCNGNATISLLTDNNSSSISFNCDGSIDACTTVTITEDCGDASSLTTTTYISEECMNSGFQFKCTQQELTLELYDDNSCTGNVIEEYKYSTLFGDTSCTVTWQCSDNIINMINDDDDESILAALDDLTSTTMIFIIAAAVIFLLCCLLIIYFIVCKTNHVASKHTKNAKPIFVNLSTNDVTRTNDEEVYYDNNQRKSIAAPMHIIGYSAVPSTVSTDTYKTKSYDSVQAENNNNFQTKPPPAAFSIMN